MFQLSDDLSAAPKSDQYATLVDMARGLLADERDLIGAELVVGPFQGKPACVRIAIGRGVCGTAAQTRATQLVRDVHAFPGHIACDAASRSEIVVPLVAPDGTLIGVWDVDSPREARFDEADQAGMEALCAVFVELAWARRIDG
jgi:GAF domain-containing protein